MKSVAVIVGTRPEAIKLIPVYRELQNSSCMTPTLISSGQHDSMLQNLWKVFSIYPDEVIQLDRESSDLYELTGKLYIQLGKLMKACQFDAVIVQGDTTTAYVGAMLGFYHFSKVIHIEAGLRTFNKYNPFPEEMNRQLIARVADYHFVPGPDHTRNLSSENLSGAIYEIGNTVIDSLYFVKNNILKEESKFQKKFNLALSGFDKMVLITSHRRENIGLGISNLCEAIKQLAGIYSNVSFIFPTHYNPSVYNKVRLMLNKVPNIFLIDPVAYDDMVFLMMNSSIIITDSGGIQEEAPTFGVPVLVTRTETERMEGIKKGMAWLVGTNPDMIVKKFHEIYSNRNIKNEILNQTNPYGDGNAAGRIREVLEENLY